MNINLTINFNELSELKNFVENLDQIELLKIKKLIKKSSQSEVIDKRGNKTKMLHEKAKEYNLLNPDASYRESLKKVGAQIREEKKTNQSETQELVDIISC